MLDFIDIRDLWSSEQYKAIHGHDKVMANADFVYMGHMPTITSNITAVEKRRARMAGRPLD